MVGVSKRTGKVWRNGRTGNTGRARSAVRSDATRIHWTATIIPITQQLSTQRLHRHENTPVQGKLLMISQRPAEAKNRAIPSHWEGDLIRGGTGNKSAIGTLAGTRQKRISPSMTSQPGSPKSTAVPARHLKRQKL